MVTLPTVISGLLMAVLRRVCLALFILVVPLLLLGFLIPGKTLRTTISTP